MKPISVSDLANCLEQIAPSNLAASWDNVGLLVGDRQAVCQRVMTCLTISEAVVNEAINKQVDLIVAHHPLPFQPLKRITTDTVYGRYLWRLIGNGTAIYSAHTAFDSAENGINQQIADRLELVGVQPLEPCLGQPSLGSGRVGTLNRPMQARILAKLAGSVTGARNSAVKLVGPPEQFVSRIGIGCGSGGSFLGTAIKANCDALVTGESNFHGCLEAEASGVALILVGHYASERFAMEWLAERLQQEFSDCQVWASEEECDPILGLGD